MKSLKYVSLIVVFIFLVLPFVNIFDVSFFTDKIMLEFYSVSNFSAQTIIGIKGPPSVTLNNSLEFRGTSPSIFVQLGEDLDFT